MCPLEGEKMYAIIDISSASISMLVCEKEHPETPIYKCREGFSSLSYIKAGEFTLQGMERIAERIAALQEQCRTLGVEKLYVVSTASTRFVTNGAEILSFVREHTGAVINRLDGQTEGWCGVKANWEYADKDQVLIDLGGASIEICRLSASDRSEVRCLPFGAITLQRKYVEGTFPNEKEQKKIRKYVKRALEEGNFEGIFPADGACGKAVLAGATNRSVYEIYRDFYELPPDGEMTIEPKKLKKLLEKLFEAHDRSQLLIRNAPDKIYFIIVAAIVLAQILKSASVECATVSEYGVKEGFLRLLTAGAVQAQESELAPTRNRVEISSVEELTAHIKRQSKGSRPASKQKKGKKSESKKQSEAETEDGTQSKNSQ